MRLRLLIPLLLLTLSLCSCATTGTTTTPLVTAQHSAELSLLTMGAALQATPAVVDALYSAGKICKDDYNKVVTIYNRALASYNLASNALVAAVTAGQDPGNSTAYLNALSAFVSDNQNVNNLVTAMGGTK